MEVGESGFFHTDLVGRRYMCYMLGRSAKLQLILIEGDTKVHKTGIVGSISARDAVAFDVSKFNKCLVPNYKFFSFLTENEYAGCTSSMWNAGFIFWCHNDWQSACGRCTV